MKRNNIEISCGNCECWVWDGKTDNGECRAYPAKPELGEIGIKHNREYKFYIPTRSRKEGCYYGFIPVKKTE